MSDRIMKPRRKVERFVEGGTRRPPTYVLSCGHVYQCNAHRWIRGVLTCPATIGCWQCAMGVSPEHDRQLIAELPD